MTRGASQALSESTARLLAAVLRDPWTAAPDSATALELVDAARRHRVLPMLGRRLRDAGMLQHWPPAFCELLEPVERDAAALETIRSRELTHVLDALAGAGARTLVFKGAALAYTHYPAPHLRSRTDTDVLVDAADVAPAVRVLESLAYRRQHETSGALVSYQCHFGKHDRFGIFHAIDLHWKISNRHALADRIGFDELWCAGIPLAPLGPAAVTVDPVHALLLAVVHRAGHHPGSSNLLWLYDIHLLVERMDDAERRRAINVAADRGLATVMCECLESLRDAFATPHLDGMIDALNSLPMSRREAILIPPAWTQAGIVRGDLRALTTWTARWRLVREHLFPSSSYIRGKYGVKGSWTLPAWYAWRIVSAAPRWLRRQVEAV